MPLYAYSPLKSPCRLCGTGFEHRQSAREPDLKTCQEGQTLSVGIAGCECGVELVQVQPN